QMVMPAVVVAFEANDLCPTSEGAGNSDSEHGRLSSRSYKADSLGRRNEAVDEGGPLDLQRVAVREEGALRRLILNRLHHGRASMTEQKRGAPHRVADVLIPVDVPGPRTLGTLDVDRKGGGETVVVRHATRKEAHRPVEEMFRSSPSLSECSRGRAHLLL